jgi:hypothetical protein
LGHGLRKEIGRLKPTTTGAQPIGGRRASKMESALGARAK